MFCDEGILQIHCSNSNVTGNSGSNPEWAHGDNFLGCKWPNQGTQQEVW